MTSGTAPIVKTLVLVRNSKPAKNPFLAEKSFCLLNVTNPNNHQLAFLRRISSAFKKIVTLTLPDLIRVMVKNYPEFGP